jgi:hypothetical protein
MDAATPVRQYDFDPDIAEPHGPLALARDLLIDTARARGGS